MDFSFVFIYLIVGIPMFLALTLLRRYADKAFYIAQCTFCMLWILSHVDYSVFKIINFVFPLWAIASLAALSVDKVKQSDKNTSEIDIEKLQAFACSKGLDMDKINSTDSHTFEDK